MASKPTPKRPKSATKKVASKKSVAKKRHFTERSYEKSYESDGAFFLKLVLCTLLGMIWMKFHSPIIIGAVPIGGLPIGMLVGLFLVSRREKLQSDRKIWYTVLVIVTIFGYFLPTPIML